MDFSLNYFITLLAHIAVFAVMVAIARVLEKIRPIQPNEDTSEILMDYKIVVVQMAMGWLFGPLAQTSGAAIVRAAGGGFIELPVEGWLIVPSAIVLILAYDFYLYWVHRLSHTVRPLWALHSLHHTAEALTLATGARHHWAQGLVQTAFFPVMAIVFKLPLPLLTIVQVIYAAPCSLSHINYRLPMGRLVTWVNSPQWHWIHHSTRAEHIDKNFCTLLPLMDLIFGTAVIPGRDEFPSATGMVPSERPTVLGSIVWPVRHYVSRWTRDPGLLFRGRSALALPSGTGDASS